MMNEMVGVLPSRVDVDRALTLHKRGRTRTRTIRTVALFPFKHPPKKMPSARESACNSCALPLGCQQMILEMANRIVAS